MEMFHSISGSIFDFPWAKMLYTALLVFFVVLFGSEIYRVWLDRTLFIGRFEFFDAGAKSDEKGQAFASQIIHQHRFLVALYQAEYERRKKAAAKTAAQAKDGDVVAETVMLPGSLAAVRDPKSELSDLEISYQGINFKQIFTALRRSVSTPNEIAGMVLSTPNEVYVSVQWPLGPPSAKVIQIPAQRDSSSAAFHVACSVVWGQASSGSSHLAQVSRQEFCDYSDAWRSFDTARSRSFSGIGLLDEDKKLLVRARGILDRLISAQPTYAEVFRLRSDIINLSPDSKDEDKKIAQADLVEYEKRLGRSPPQSAAAQVSPALERLLTSRPALIVRNDELVSEVPGDWKQVFSKSQLAVKRSIASTARVLAPETGTPWTGTAFVVGKDLVMTANFVAHASIRPVIEFDGAGASVRYAVSEIVIIDDDRSVAIFRVPGLDTKRFEPLGLVKTKPDDVVSRKVFVSGFPSADGRLPELQKIFSFDGGKRIMPGEIRQLDDKKLVYDAITSGGTAGGPVVDFNSGDVIALHWGGKMMTETSKEAYGTPAWKILENPAIRSLLVP